MNKTQWLEVKDLRKSFSTRSGPLEILSGISFSLDRGEAMAIMGPSGSGKSTLLYIVGTLEKPTKGQVLFEGQNPFDLSEPQLASFRNQSIGFVFQDHHLLPQYSVIENVLLPATVYTGDSADPESRAHHLLSRLGLSNRLEHRPAELSGGERQRTAIARALINGPKILLCDEPTGNLDRSNAESIGSLFLELCEEEETTLLLATHNKALADHFQNQVNLLDGRLQPIY